MRLGTIINYRSSHDRRQQKSDTTPKFQSSSAFTLTLFHLTFYLLVFGYLYLGALVFYHIEAEAELEEILKQENEVHPSVKQEPDLHLDKISDIAKIMAVRYNSDRNVVESLLKDFVVELKARGVLIKESPPALNEAQEKEIKLKWDFPSSFLFAFTILTTIGYGNIAPATVGGKIFTMIYAFLGVPMFLVALIDIGAFAQKGIRILIDAIRRRFVSCKNKQDGPDENKRSNQHVVLQKMGEFFCTMLVFAAFILLGAALLPIWESHLSLFTASYYTFITISAIGLGDIVPQNMTLLPLTLIYITVGLWFTLIVTEQIADLFKLVHFAGRTLSGVKDLQVWIGGNRITVGHFIDAVGAKAGVSEHVMNNIDWDHAVNEMAAGKMPTNPETPLMPEITSITMNNTSNINAIDIADEPRPTTFNETVSHAQRTSKVHYKNSQISCNEWKEVQKERIFCVNSTAKLLPRPKSMESMENFCNIPSSTVKKVETMSYFSNTEEWIHEPYATYHI